jgi:hypothetical protein
MKLHIQVQNWGPAGQSISDPHTSLTFQFTILLWGMSFSQKI